MKRILCIVSAVALIGGSIAIAQSKGPSKPGDNPPPKQSPPPGKGPSTTPEKSPPPKQSPPPGKGPSTTPEKSPPPKQSPPPGKGPSTTPEKSPPPKQSPPPGKGPSTTPEKSPPPKQSPPPGKGPSTTPEKSPPPKQSPPPGKGPSTTPDKDPPPSKGSGSTADKNPPRLGGSSGSDDYLRGGSDYLKGKPTPREYRPDERRRDDGPAFVPRTTGPRDMPSKVPQGDQRFNLGRPSDSRSPGVATIPRPVIVDSRGSSNRGSLPYQVRRSEEYRVGLRVGYYHYDPWWQPYHYGYPYYVFVPTPYDCFFSPYYYYWTCPPYIHARRVIIVVPRVFIIISDPIRWVYCGYDTRYNYGYGSNYGYASYSSVDRAVSRLVDAFRYSDTRSLDELVPRGSTVDVYLEGDYAYSLSSDDYYDMTADMLQSVYTRSFVIERVQRTKDGDIWVVARHEFIDAWNATQRTWLGFLLERQGDRYVIRQAGTYSYRP
jgi:hypothetical protein